MKSQDSSKYILIVVMIAIVFFLYRSCSKSKITAPQTNVKEAPQAMTQQAQQPQIIENTQNLQSYNREVDKRRAAAVARERVGMQSMALEKNTKGQYELKFELVIKPIWCKAGDYETIKSIVSDYQHPLILISLESTSSSTKISKPLRMTLMDFGKGFKHSFILDGIKADSNESLALRICMDRNKKDSCSDAKPVDQKILGLIGRKTNAVIKDDVTFYFQNLYVKNGEIVSQGAMDYSKNYEKRLKNQLNKEGFELDSFPDNWKMARTIRSEPIKLLQGKLTAYVSRNDPKCTLE